MAITLSNAHFSPKDSTGYFVYALRRDEDDMLWLTKVSTASTTETFDDDDYVEEITEQKALANNSHDKYQQIRFDRRNLNYYLDTDGYFVLQVNGTHSYSGPV